MQNVGFLKTGSYTVILKTAIKIISTILPVHNKDSDQTVDFVKVTEAQFSTYYHILSINCTCPNEPRCEKTGLWGF